MENTQDEFITKTRKNKPPYEAIEKSDGTKIVYIDSRRKLKPRDKEYIEMLVKAGYIPKQKRTDITKDDMINYVKKNYDQEELNVLNEKFNTINLKDENTNNLITFATIKSWFKQTYIYYPKGINYNFGNNQKAKDKKERFIKAFDEHKKALKESRKPQGEIEQEQTEEEKGKRKK